MAKELDLPLKEFATKYLRKIGNRFSLKEKLPNYDCVFLKDRRCSVYESRPRQCRTFPWWQQHLESEEAWKRAALECEGIGSSGQLFTKEEIDEAKAR